MSMPLSEYNRSRPASALGGVSSGFGSVNPAGKISYTNGISVKTRSAQNATSNARENDYDSDDLDFDAYKQSYFPHTTTSNDVERGSSHGRNSSALGAVNSVSHLNDGPGKTDYGLRTRSNSSGAYLSNPVPSTSMAVSGGSNTESMATRGRLRRIRDTLNASQQQGKSALEAKKNSTYSAKPSAAIISPPRPSTIEPSSIAVPAKDSPQAKPPPSPPSDPNKSGDSDFSLSDIESLQNGIAARKHYRLLEGKLKQMREDFKKQSEAHGLSEQELTQAVKSIELEDEEERELFHELWEYVERDGKLGSCWERFCQQQMGEKPPFQDSDEEDFDKRIDDIRNLEEESLVAAGHYHDDLDEPYQVVDLASVEQEKRLSATLGNRPTLKHLRTTSTSDLPLDQNAPSSATNSSNNISLSNYMQQSQNSPSLETPEEFPNHQARSHSVSTGPGRYQAPAELYTRTSHIPPESQRGQQVDEEEEDVPISRANKFQNLALNDTLQLRHQQLQSSSQGYSQNSAYVRTSKNSTYAPPNRAQKAMRGERGSSDDRGAMDPSPPVPSERIPQETRRAAKAPSHTTTNSSSTAGARTRSRVGYSQSATQSQTGTMRPAGKQRFEEREIAISSAEERGKVPSQHASRPGSSRSVREEDRDRRRPAANATTNGRRSIEENVEDPGFGAGRSGVQAQASYHDGGRDSPYHARSTSTSTNQAQLRASQPSAHYHIQEAIAAYNNSNYFMPPTQTFEVGRVSPPADDRDRQGWNSNTAQSAQGRSGPVSGPVLARSSTMPNSDPVQAQAGPQAAPTSSSGKPPIMTVNKHQYQRLELIGKGGSSKVYRVMRVRDSKQFALKRVELNAVDDEAMRSYTAEISLLRRLSSYDCVVKLIDEELKGKGSGTLLLVMELGETDFARLLSERQGKPIHLPWITMYFKQMLEAVNVIHEERIVHSDLKPANFVLIRGSLKLIDFGIAKAIANDTTNIQRDNQIGTLNYMSPEAMEAPPGCDRLKIGRASDVWSLGCILYQMVYGVAPFAALQQLHQKMRAIADPNHVIDFPEYAIPVVPKDRSGTGRPEPIADEKKKQVKVPSDMITTMRRCLDHNAKARPTIEELLKEPWLNGFASSDGIERPEDSALRLAEDEAIISMDYMQQLINYVLKTHDHRWNEEDPENAENVYNLAAQIMPELRSLRTSTEYIP